MSKLNQIIAIEKSVKATAARELDDAYHISQKPVPFTGISRSYQPKDDEGEQFPSESTKVQLTVDTMLTTTARALERLFDVTATKEWANTAARADVVVDGVTLLEDVPVTYLLFLEKQLVSLHTFVSKLPTLDPTMAWHFDDTADCWAALPVQTHRSKKIPRNHVKAEATDKHPAQVEVYNEDVMVGTWNTIHFSGALPAARVRTMTDRIVELQRAVKFAREEANTASVTDISIGHKVFDYLLAP